jgi:hypothetical protein
VGEREEAGEAFIDLPAGVRPSWEMELALIAEALLEEVAHGDEVTAAGGIGFDIEAAAVMGEGPEQVGGEGDVGGFVAVVVGDLDGPTGGGGGHEQGGGEL